MIQRFHVCAEYFWFAISQCKSSVSLPGDAVTDLRLLSDAQREAILPSAGNGPVTLDLQFGDRQDYIRFVLAYLLTQEERS